MHPPTMIFTLPAGTSADQVRAALGASFGLREHEAEERRYEFLDTFDARLWRRGSRLCRLREGRDHQLVLTTADGDELVEAARAVEFADDLSGGALGPYLAKVAKNRRLLARVDLTLTRCRHDLLDELEKTVARVSVEFGQARSTDSEDPAPTRPMVAMSALRGYGTELDRARRILVDELGARGATMGRMEVALDALGRDGLADPSRLDLDLSPEMDARRGVRSILDALRRVVVATAEGTRDDVDIEFLHDFRVAVRRARSIIGQLAAVFPDDEATALLHRLKWIARATGRVRDLDVFLEELDGAGERREPLEPLVEEVRAAKRREHRQMAKALASPEFDDALAEWGEFAAVVDAPREEQRRLDEVVAQQIDRRFRKMVGKVKRALRKNDEEGLHRARVDGKKLRYLLDCTSGVFPRERVESAVVSLKKIQDELGNLNDAVSQRAIIEEFAESLSRRSPAPYRALLEMGALIERTRARGDRARRRFEERWRDFGGRETRELFATLTAEASDAL